MAINTTNSPRMYCSISLSRSESSKFAGGGLRSSFGLYIELDLTFPIDLIFCVPLISVDHNVATNRTHLDLLCRPVIHRQALPEKIVVVTKLRICMKATYTLVMWVPIFL